MFSNLLNYLSTHGNQWHTLAALQTQTGLSSAGIAAGVEALTGLGYRIDRSPVLGIRMQTASRGLAFDRIERGLTVRWVGRRLLVYRSTGSTNDVAWNYAGELALGRRDYDGLAVFADHQRAGRGRLGRTWLSPPGGGLLCSILLYNRPGLAGLNGPALSVAAGISVAQTVDRLARTATQIKWPNDVLWQGKKLAGVMVESRMIGEQRVYVLGIGINCGLGTESWPGELAGQAVALQQITGQSVDRESLAGDLLMALDGWLAGYAGGPVLQEQTVQALHEVWAEKCVNLGQRLTVIRNGIEFSGRVIDVDIDQGLLLQLDSGGIRLFEPEMTTVKVASR